MITRRKSNSVSLIKTAVRKGVESCEIEPFNFDCMKDGSWVAKYVTLVPEEFLNLSNFLDPVTFDLSEYLEGSPVNKYECLFRCKIYTGPKVNSRGSIFISSEIFSSTPVCTSNNQVQGGTSQLVNTANEQLVFIPTLKTITLQTSSNWSIGTLSVELKAFRPLAS